MKPKLEYINQGRSGYVVYQDGQGEIKLYFEFGGENCVAIISVPTTEEWTIKTKRPTTVRQTILTFVAEQAIKDQSPNSYYNITETGVEIFSKEN